MQMRSWLTVTCLVVVCGSMAAQGSAQPVAWVGTMSQTPGNGAVRSVDITTGVASAPTVLGGQIEGLALNASGSRLYVSSYTLKPQEAMLVFDTSNRTVVATVPMAFPLGLALSPNGQKVYVGGAQLRVVSTATNTLTKTIPNTADTRNIAFSPDGSRAYAPLGGSDALAVINTATDTVVTSLPVADYPTGVAVTPDGQRVFVTHVQVRAVTVFNAVSNTVLTTIPLPVGTGSFSGDVEVTPDGKKAYVSDFAGYVHVIDVASNTVTKSINLRASGSNDNGQGIAMSSDGRYVTVTTWNANAVKIIDTTTDAVVRAVGGLVRLPDHIALPPRADVDTDGLPDDWETRFGLDPSSGAGVNGASGDPDADGVTNADELQRGTHPRGLVKRYMAEGATSSFIDTRIALLNTTTTDAVATLRMTRPGAAPLATTVSLPARRRVTVDPKTIPGLASAEFSTEIECDQGIVADRTMTWDVAAGYGGHAETAVTAPSPIWYLAEGATHNGFELFYLLQNPAATPTTVRVRYLRPSGAPLDKEYILPPASRTNIWVNSETFPGLGTALSSTDVSAVIESLDATPIIVERAMYLSNQGRVFNAGHESAGVTAPALQWFLAEGATGPYFDLFVLIANPNSQPANVRVTYLLTTGETLNRTLVAPANSRSNIWVDVEQFSGVAGFPLADVAVSTTVASENGVPVIVERALWWPGDFATWHEAHNSAGALQTGTSWALAEGEQGGARGEETFILIANTSAFAGQARVTLYFEDGTSAVRTYDLAANSRSNVAVGPDFGGAAAGKRFGAIVESLGTTPAQIVVERAVYWNAGGVTWAAGTNALATRLQ